jgi:hypothetical protein
MIRIRRKGWICNPGFNRCFNNRCYIRQL